ncbi:hypothetical protein D3C78_1888640 [compost metagenome]
MLFIHGHFDHFGFHWRTQCFGVVIEELVEQLDVLLGNQGVGGRSGLLKATGDVAQVAGNDRYIVRWAIVHDFALHRH